MCGRYVSRSAKQQIAESFHAAQTIEANLAPSYNVAPQSHQPVVRLNPESGQRELALLRWGLIPFWAKDAKIAYSTINARAETLATSPVFREAVKRRRCLIPADAFYEWEKSTPKDKQPYAIALADDSLFAFAGLWDSWHDKASDLRVDTYTIITTDPNSLMERFHDRMPVILPPNDYERWLTPTDPAHLPTDLLRPYPAHQMKAWKVSKSVGNTRNNSPGLLEPAEKPVTRQESLFADLQ